MVFQAILNSPFFFRFPPPKPDLQPAVVAAGDLGHLGGDPRHLKVIHLEDPTPRDVDIGGLGDVDDGFGLGARDVVEVGFISAIEAGLEREPKQRLRRDSWHGTTSYCWWWCPPKTLWANLQSSVNLTLSSQKCYGPISNLRHRCPQKMAWDSLLP